MSALNESKPYTGLSAGGLNRHDNERRSRLLLILLLGCALTNTSAVAQDLQSRVDIEGALQAAIEAEAGGDINKSFALYKKAYEGANRILPSDDTVRIDATFRLAFTL